MTALAICLYVAAGIQVFGQLAMTTRIGKPRDPITGDVAALAAVLTAFSVVVIVIAAMKLG